MITNNSVTNTPTVKKAFPREKLPWLRLFSFNKARQHSNISEMPVANENNKINNINSLLHK